MLIYVKIFLIYVNFMFIYVKIIKKKFKIFFFNLC